MIPFWDLKLLRNPLVGACAFVCTIFPDFDKCKLAARRDNALFLQPLVEIFIGDLVDGNAASKTFKQLPSSDDFTPLRRNFPFKHFGFCTRPIATQSEQFAFKVRIVFQIGFKGDISAKKIEPVYWLPMRLEARCPFSIRSLWNSMYSEVFEIARR